MENATASPGRIRQPGRLPLTLAGMKQADPTPLVEVFFPACSLSPPGGDRGECGGRDRSIFLFFKGHLFLVSVSVDSFSKHLRARSFFSYYLLLSFIIIDVLHEI